MSTKKQVQFKSKKAPAQEAPQQPALSAADQDQLEQDNAFWTIKVT